MDGDPSGDLRSFGQQTRDIRLVRLRQARPARFNDHPNYIHVQADLADRAAVEQAFATHKPDRVINLAAQAGVRYAAENPHVYVQSNVVGSCTSWKAAATSGVAPYRLYNIGNEQPVELLRYIEVLEQCLGRKAQMELLPLQAGDVPDTEADVSDLIADVGYRPRVPVEEGVAKFVAWYRDYYRA